MLLLINLHAFILLALLIGVLSDGITTIFWLLLIVLHMQTFIVLLNEQLYFRPSHVQFRYLQSLSHK
jgi:hypothetical protein